MNSTSLPRHLIFCALVILVVLSAPFPCALAASEQDSLAVSASINKQAIRVNEVATLSVTVEGLTDCDVPHIPDIEGLQIRYVGPSTQISWINGELTQSVSFRYTVQSTQPGTYKIPAIKVSADGKIGWTEPIEIEVTAATDSIKRQQSASDSSLFLLLEPEKTTVYPGEKLQVKAILCIDGVRITEVTYPQLSGSGFLVGEFSEPLQGRQTVNGRTLQTLEFTTYVTAAVTGELNVGPASIRCEIIVPAQSRNPFADFFAGGFPDFDSFFDSPFFSSTTTTTVTVQSEPLTLTVKPFPDAGKPPSFHGAVGSFTVSASATPTAVRVGDPINLRIEVSGDGNMRSVLAPRIYDSDQFKTYDPIVQSTSESSKVFEQVIVVRDISVSQIPPVSLAFFNPKTERYEIASSEAIPITVTPGAVVQAGSKSTARQTTARSQSSDEWGSPQTGLLYIKRSPGRLALLGDPIRSHGFVAYGTAVATLFLAASVAMSAYKRASQGRDQYRQREKACQNALSVIKQLESEVSRRDTRKVVDEARKTLASVIRMEGGLKLQDENAADEILRRLDTLYYSPVCPSEQEAREALSLCRQAVEHIKDNCKRPDREPVPPASALLLLLTLAIAVAPHALASTDSRDTALKLFYRGNSLYESGDYQLAADAYKQAIERGYVSGSLYYNLGNALAKAESYAEALLSYLRAAEFIPRDRDLQHNTEFVMTALGLGAPSSQMPLESNSLNQTVRRFTQSEWAIAAVSAYIAFCVLAAWKLLRRDKPSPPTATIAAVGLILVVTVCGTLYRRNLYLNDHRVVVTVQEAPVRFEPDASAPVRYTASAGSILYEAGEPDGDFLIVRDQSGQLGWIEASAIQPVRPEAK